MHQESKRGRQKQRLEESQTPFNGLIDEFIAKKKLKMLMITQKEV